MSTPQANAPSTYATVGQRLGAYGLDAVLSGAVVLLSLLATLVFAYVVSFVSSGLAAFVVVFGYIFAGIGYSIYVLYLTATRGYTPGKKVMGLRVVDETSGTPIGWGRTLLRGLVLGLLITVSCGILAIVIVLVANGHPRRQGWHDLAAKSVVVPADSLERAELVEAPAESGVLPVALPSTAATPPRPESGITAHPEDRQSSAPTSPPLASPLPSVSSVTPAPDLVVKSGPPTPVGPPPGVAPPPSSQPVSPPRTAPPAEPRVQEISTGVDESTRMAVRRTPAGPVWTLTSVGGVPFTVAGPTLVGRDPESGLVENATTWSVDDPDRTVSKTHALVGIDAGELWVEDWDSTNGVLIKQGDSETELQTRVRTRLNDGDYLVLGDLEFEVRRTV